MKESENITQTEENPKAGNAIHSQDGFKNQTEESREDKSFSFSAPQTSTTVPDHETQVAWAGQDMSSAAFPGGRLYTHSRCTQEERMLWVTATILREFLDDTGILQHMLQIDYQLERSALLI